jgi:superoxide reductase
MPKINYAPEVSAEMKEAKRDYLDRHTPHVVAPASVKKGESFMVTIKMGNEYVHPDVDDHHIQRMQLFNGDRLLASTTYEPGTFTAGFEEAKGFSQVTFQIALAKKGRLTAMSYCTLHGVWMSEVVVVDVA